MVPDAELLFRLFLAAFLGALVGLEREYHGRPAGVRTYLLLSMGSALFMVVSEFIYVKYQGKVPGIPLQVDPARIAAQAVSGIGFLGAGVILRHKETVRGLTTAACVWTVCAVGLAAGSGFYLFASAVTAMTVISLLGLKLFERRMSKDWYHELDVVSADLPGQLEHIREIIEKYRFKVISYGLKKDRPNREMSLNFRLRTRTVQPNPQVLLEVSDLEGVKTVQVE